MSRVLGITLLTVAALACGCSRSLFNGKDLSGWTEIQSKGAWTVETKEMNPAEGPILKCSGQKNGYAWLSTNRKYRDFELTLDWRIQDEGNTGVFCRAPDREGRTSMKGFEVQARDDHKDKDLADLSGAVFNRIAAAGKFSNPVGQWNHLKITCKGRHVRIELNDHVTVDADMDFVPAKGSDPPMWSVPNEGYVGLQNHGSPAEFRNIRIREMF